MLDAYLSGGLVIRERVRQQLRQIFCPRDDAAAKKIWKNAVREAEIFLPEHQRPFELLNSKGLEKQLSWDAQKHFYGTQIDFVSETLRADIPDIASAEGIRQITRRGMIMLLLFYEDYFAHGSSEMFPTIPQGIVRTLIEMRQTPSENETVRAGNSTKPKIAAIPERLIDHGRQVFYERQYPIPAGVDTDAQHVFMNKNRQAIEARLRAEANMEEARFTYLSVAKDAIAVLDDQRIPLKIILLPDLPGKNLEEYGECDYEILDYRELDSPQKLNICGNVDPMLADFLQIFHYPDFYVYWRDHLPNLETTSLRAQLQILEYFTKQDRDGVVKFCRAWKARFFAEAPHLPPQHYRYMLDRYLEPLTHFLEAFSVCGFDAELQEKLLEIAGRRDASDVLAEMYAITQSAFTLTEQILESYRNFELAEPAQADILATLFAKAKSLLTEYADNPASKNEILKKLGFNMQQIRLQQQVVSALTPIERRNLDIEKLTLTEFQVFPVNALPHQLKKQYAEILIKTFGPIEAEVDEFFSDGSNEAALYYAGETLICGLGLTPLKNGAKYIRLFAKNPVSPLRGVSAQAFLAKVIDELKAQTDLECMFRPWVTENSALPNEHGFSGYAFAGKNIGCATDNYIRFRRKANADESTPEEEKKQLAESMLESFSGDSESQSVIKVTEGKKSALVRMKVEGLNHHSEGRDEKVYGELERLFHDGLVVTYVLNKRTKIYLLMEEDFSQSDSNK